MKKTVIGGFLVTFGLLLMLIADAGVSGLWIVLLFAGLLIIGNILFWWGSYEWLFKDDN